MYLQERIMKRELSRIVFISVAASANRRHRRLHRHVPRTLRVTSNQDLGSETHLFLFFSFSLSLSLSLYFSQTVYPEDVLLLLTSVAVLHSSVVRVKLTKRSESGEFVYAKLLRLFGRNDELLSRLLELHSSFV